MTPPTAVDVAHSPRVLRRRRGAVRTHAPRFTRPASRVRPIELRLQPSRRRLVAFLLALMLGFGAISARLVFVQALSGDRYASFGQSQRLRTVELPAHRGSILDRSGAELAISIPQRTVWADPRLVRDPAAAARALAPVLKVPEEDLRARLAASGAFVYLARKVDDATADAVRALRLPGVAFLEEPKRFDPAGTLAVPLLGQVGTDNQGLSGLELQYEKQLAGQPGKLQVERDPSGHRIASGIHELLPSRKGDDLVLTLDRSMQYETERSLTAEILSSNAKGGMAIVMDPSSGEILAMANLVKGADGIVPSPSNAAVTRVYEPGSANKIITVAAAIEEGLVTPETRFGVPDHLLVSDAKFQDHDPHPVQSWTVTDIVANSSNIGTIMIGQKLGKTKLDRYLREFGLGKRSGLAYPGESAGLLLNPGDYSGTSLPTVSIGQGVAVTALQLLGAFNTIANGGVYVTPKLVKGVAAHGRVRETPPSERRPVISQATARQMTGMLTEVVRVGTAKAAAVAGYRVAGKTGTARKPLEGARGYKEGAYLATFGGYVPAESPRLSAIVVLDEPYPIYGGLVSAPVFADVASYGLRLFKVPPPVVADGPSPFAVPAVSAETARVEHDAPASVAQPRASSATVTTTAPVTTPPPVTTTPRRPTGPPSAGSTSPTTLGGPRPTSP